MKNSLVSEIANCLELEIANSRPLNDAELSALKMAIGVHSFSEPPRVNTANLLLFGPEEAEAFWRHFKVPIVSRCELPEHKIWLFAFQILNHPALKVLARFPAQGAIA